MLGDAVERALKVVGIDSERVERWTGKPCRCKARREKLNRIGIWAGRVLAGKIDKAKEYLEEMLGEK